MSWNFSHQFELVNVKVHYFKYRGIIIPSENHEIVFYWIRVIMDEFYYMSEQENFFWQWRLNLCICLFASSRGKPQWFVFSKIMVTKFCRWGNAPPLPSPQPRGGFLVLGVEFSGGCAMLQLASQTSAQFPDIAKKRRRSRRASWGAVGSKFKHGSSLAADGGIFAWAKILLLF